MAQTFATVSGASYLVRFDLAGAPGCGPTVKSVRVSSVVRINGSALALEGVPTTGANPWTFSGVASHETANTELFGWGDNSATGGSASVWVDASMRNTLEARLAMRIGSTITSGHPLSSRAGTCPNAAAAPEVNNVERQLTWTVAR